MMPHLFQGSGGQNVSVLQPGVGVGASKVTQSHSSSPLLSSSPSFVQPSSNDIQSQMASIQGTLYHCYHCLLLPIEFSKFRVPTIVVQIIFCH